MRKNVWDHPRTCGEKPMYWTAVLLVLGSPPHMRGKDGKEPSYYYDGGITPAHAGKSPRARAWKAHDRDHPRTCGEKTQEVTKYKAYDILHA